MLVQGIKSRPVYSGLVIDAHAPRHLFAIENEGADAIVEQTDKDFLARAEILYVGDAEHGARLCGLKAFDVWIAHTIPILLNRLKVTLQSAKMGTRLYIAGTEGFIGQTIQVALEVDIDFNSIRTEHRGSLARRVQCVHCKGITDNVTTQPYICSHCGLKLLVRDHYSRRLAAFQGVCIDAEELGTAPKPEVMFP